MGMRNRHLNCVCGGRDLTSQRGCRKLALSSMASCSNRHFRAQLQKAELCDEWDASYFSNSPSGADSSCGS